MGRRSLFDTPTVPRLQDIIENVRRGVILVPDFQRPFVWDDKRRLKLMDSIYRGMPIGSFLVWRTSQHPLKTIKNLGPFVLPIEPPEGLARTYLLDGHQRLATLFSALNWDEDSAMFEQQGVSWPIYFDLAADADDIPFVYFKRKGEPPPSLLPMNLLLEPRRLFGFQKRLLAQGMEDASDRAEALASLFKDYVIPVIPMISDDLKLATESFVRINTQGKDMKEIHMVRALAYTDLRAVDRIESIKDRLAPLGWKNLDDQVLLNALRVRWAMSVYSSNLEQLHKKLAEEGYQQPLEDLELSLVAAVVLLSQWHVAGPAALPYAYQLICLAEVLRRHDFEVDTYGQQAARAWFWATTYTGYFGGMKSRGIREAVDHLDAAMRGDAGPYPADLPDTPEPLPHFNLSSARTKALLLSLIARIGDKDKRQRTARHFGGSGAVDKLFSHLSADLVENRVVALPEELMLLRQCLVDPSMKDKDRLRKHYLLPDWDRPLVFEADEQEFLARRLALINRMEERGIGRLALADPELRRSATGEPVPPTDSRQTSLFDKE